MAHQSLPSRSPLVREAAELIAHYEAMWAARRNVNLRMGLLAKEFLIRLTQAQGRIERHVVAPPQEFLKRSMTIHVRRVRGHWQAYLAPNDYSRDFAVARLDEGDAGFFHRPEDWADTRYFDMFLGAVGWPQLWKEVDDPLAGAVAIAAYAAKECHELDEKNLKAHLPAVDGLAWTPELLNEINQRVAKVRIPDREPPFIPIRFLRHARQKEVGYGEILAFWLYGDAAGPGLTAREVALILNLGTSDQAKKMSRDAAAKLGGLDTMTRLVPPWPKPSQSVGHLESAAAKPAPKIDRRGGE